jgi:putative acetyltransferase
VAENVTVREVSDGDAASIRGVVKAAFGQPGEAHLVEALRAAGEVAVELAALVEGELAGHVLFSRLGVTPDSRRIAALAPVSVAPSCQRRGIGSALIRAGIEACRAEGFDAIAVLGEPEYYGRFGFVLETARALPSVYSGAYYQALELRTGALAGGSWRVSYPAAFSALDE